MLFFTIKICTYKIKVVILQRQTKTTTFNTYNYGKDKTTNQHLFNK